MAALNDWVLLETLNKVHICYKITKIIILCTNWLKALKTMASTLNGILWPHSVLQNGEQGVNIKFSSFEP
jgi:hypothetical protein